MRWQLRPESNEMLHLDCLRLIASAGIVTLHCVGRLDGWHPSVDGFRLFVDLFFAISGYVIAFVYGARLQSPADYRSFLQKRFARLVPLHWATLAVYLVIGLLIERTGTVINHPQIYDPACRVPNFLLLHAAWTCPHLSFNGPSWSISAEMFMYLLAPAIFWLMHRSVVAIAVLTLAIWATLYMLSTPADPWFLRTSNGGVVRALPSFMLGALLFQLRMHIRFAYAVPVMWLCLMLFIAAAMNSVAPHLLVLLLYATFIAGIAADHGAGSRATQLGAAGAQLTYSSYMLHDLILVVLIGGVIEHALHLSGSAKNLAILGAFLAVWPISWLSFALFETPLRRLIGGRR